MPRRRPSLFPQSLERAAFIAYFLGAVVPLLALAFVVNRYAVPHFREGLWPYVLATLILSFSGLSLGSFFLLRRATWNTIERMNDDNRRLETLLEGSDALSRAQHGDEAIALTVALALRLTGAEAAYVFRAGDEEEDTSSVRELGTEAALLREKFRNELASMVELALSNERPVLHGDGSGDEAAARLTAVAIPLASVKHRGALIAARSGGERFRPAAVGALSTLATLASVALENVGLREAQQNFFVHVTDMLLGALDTHMELQTGHSRRVAHFSIQVARQLGFEEDRLQRLHFAALLHDIGMLKIAPEMRHSRQACRQHPTLGFRMLSPIRLWEDIAPFVLLHHEWFDGHGYPKGLAGEEIPLESRIIGIAEAFDSMTSQSTYKTPVPTEEALRRIDDAAGTQFDPQLAPIFVELVRRGEIQAS